MHGRSVLLLYRLSRLPSPLVNACFLGNNYPNHLSLLPNQNQRFLAQKSNQIKPPGRFRRFIRWFGWGAPKIVPIIPTPPTPPTTMQRVKRFLALSPSIERFFLRSHIIEDEDLARLISKTGAIAIYAIVAVTTLGTLGVDTKPLLAGIGITGFTIGFALKEVATNFISGIFLVINKPFVRGCRIKIHGSGGGIEGLVHYIDIRYVHLKTKDRGIVMVPSAIVYTNAFTVFPADDEANAGFMDMTKPPNSDPTKPAPTPTLPPASSSSSSKITNPKQDKLKMNFETEQVGAYKKSPFKDKL